MRFVLASASPARRQTLRQAGVETEVIVSGVDEEAITAATTADLTQVLARAKAHAVASGLSGAALVLGCDSMLEFRQQPLGKPGSAATATTRWNELRGQRGVLHTGHTLLRVDAGKVVAEVGAVTSTEVHFADPSDDEIAAYVATGEPLAVAGAFTTDGLGGWFVESVVGDPHTVVGLSLPRLRLMLIELGLGLADLGWPTRPS